MPPQASIVMPVYNVAAYVGETIASVQAQTLQSWELIVVDDGSTDETAKVVQALVSADSRIRLVSQGNAGVAAARNRGLGHVQGDFLVFLDGDDLWHKDYLQRAVAQMEATQADFFFCGFEYLEANGALRPCVMKLPQGIPSSGCMVEGLLSGGLTCCMGSVALRLTQEIRSLRFTEGCRYGEDTEYLLRMLPVARSICFLAEPLFRYRVRPGSATQQSWNWRNRLDGIYAMERALDHLHAYPWTCRPAVIEEQRSRRHYWKYRLLYRMVKGGAWKDVHELLGQQGWRDSLHSVVQRESHWHRRKAQALLGGNRLVWRLVWLYARLNPLPRFASQKAP